MLALLLLFVIAVFGQTRPNLNSDFTGDVMYTIQVDKQPARKFQGKWYNDLTGERERFDVTDTRIGELDFWRFWTTKTGGSEYEYNPKTKVCHDRDFDHRHRHLDVFGWVKNAKLNGTCSSTGALWSFENGPFEFDLCASKDGKTPLWVDRQHLVERRLVVTASFSSYSPGRPSSSVFSVPQACPSAPPS
jgi:hypothetical protein